MALDDLGAQVQANAKTGNVIVAFHPVTAEKAGLRQAICIVLPDLEYLTALLIRLWITWPILSLSALTMVFTTG